MRELISFEPIVRRRGPVIALFGLLVAAAAPGLLRLRADNSAEAFFAEDRSEVARFEQLERDFGRDRGVRLVVEGDGLWTRRGLSWLGALESGVPFTGGGPGGVYGAAGPVLYHRWRLPTWPPDDPRAFRRLVLADPVDRNAGWVGRDGRLVTVIAGLFKLSPERREATLAALEARLAPEPLRAGRPDAPGDGRSPPASSAAGPPPGVHGFLAGLPMVGRAFDRAEADMLQRLVPALLLVAAALLAAIFRSVSGVVLPLLLVAVTLVVTLGLMGYAGARLDFVVVLLVPLAFVIALATGVHVLAYHRRILAAGDAPARAAVATYRVKAWPVVWTGLTTCAGFASLAASPVPPVRALGLWTAFAIAFLTLAALSLFPALLAALPGGGPAPRTAPGGPSTRPPAEPWIARRARSWARAAVARPGVVYAAFGAVAIAAAAGLPRLAVDTSTLGYFRPDHPVARQVRRLEAAGLGPVSASLVLEGSEDAPFDRPQALRRLASLAAELRREPLVAGVVGAGDLVADHARLAPAPEAGTDALAAARAAMTRTPGLSLLLRSVLTGDARRTRLLLFTPMRGYTELEPFYRRAEAAARRAFPGAGAWVTGEYPLILSAQRSLLRTIILSLGATFLVIAALLAWLLGSGSLAVRALLPNLWPVLLVLGAMGWLGVPVDSTTVMVAAVALGLAVDDTLHTLGHLRLRVAAKEAAGAGGRPELVAGCLGEVAGGHVTSSLILCLGFAVAAASELLPVARFGALAALAVAGALAADLLLVPALLARVPERLLRRLAPSG